MDTTHSPPEADASAETVGDDPAALLDRLAEVDPADAPEPAERLAAALTERLNATEEHGALPDHAPASEDQGGAG